jgi:uncharacterized protein with GYD domain
MGRIPALEDALAVRARRDLGGGCPARGRDVPGALLGAHADERRRVGENRLARLEGMARDESSHGEPLPRDLIALGGRALERDRPGASRRGYALHVTVDDGRKAMPFFMVQATYEASAAAAFARSPEDREKSFRMLIERAGGKLHSFYFALGEEDVVAILEAPDSTTAVAIAMAVTGAGHTKTYRTTALLTSTEALAAMAKAGTLSYKPPKG